MVSTYALNALAEAGSTVIVCDGCHMPSAALLPAAGHTTTQRIQAACLRRNGQDGADDVELFSKFVSADDADNRYTKRFGYENACAWGFRVYVRPFATNETMAVHLPPKAPVQLELF